MTILANDIKLVASRVMDDVPEGGGAPTATVIVDGASNSIFQDISELDRAGGDVSVRKIFIHVQTNNTDTYLGSNVIVAEPPTDPNVSVTLFSTGSTFDERQAATGRVESYLVAGPEWPGFLFENHIAGQRAIQLFQRPDVAPPNIGETIILVYNEGLVSERRQYVRVIDTATVIRTFTKSNGEPFLAAIVTCDLSDPLRLDYPGSPPSETFTRAPNASKIRETTVGDAAVYAGVSPTVAAINIGDVSATVASIFTQLVPSAQTEIPLVDQNAAGQYFTLVPASDGTVSFSTTQPLDSTTSLSLSNPVVPGSLTIVIGARTLTDTGGQVFDAGTVVGVIDYGRGVITFPALSGSYTGTKTITFKIAGAPLRVGDTAQIPVTPESRSYNYIMTILPTPGAGSVLVSYRAQGRWYDLRDNGGGVLRGTDPAYGVGSVNYGTGAVSITLGALPDDGSAVLFTWASKVNYINRSAMVVPKPSVRMQLPEVEIDPGSISITWNDGTPHTATDNGKGAISGGATGTVEYSTGLINLAPNNLPAGGQEYAVAYSKVSPADVKSFSVAGPARGGGGNITLNLGQTNVTPGTVKMAWPVEINDAYYAYHASVAPSITAKDDGVGNIVVETGRVAGTINYSTGVIVFQPDGNVTGRLKTVLWNGIAWYNAGFSYSPIPTVFPSSGTVTADFQIGGLATALPTATFVSDAVKFDLTNRYGEQIVPGSVNFSLGGRTYFDRLGSIYVDLNVATGEATSAGAINYSSGEVVLDDWTPGVLGTITLVGLLTTTGDHTVSAVTFRVPVSPVRPGSLQILATKASGGTVNVTAALDGDFDDTGVRGTVDYETGVVNIEFGQLLPVAGNESQPWFDPSAVVGGNIWKPDFVFADTLRFNAVAFSYLPLDASVLGLDPVRLPQDGKVPIFRPGSFAVIGHTKKSGPTTVSNGQTINLARVRLSRVRVVGANGAAITDGYTTDLEAGTITFANVAGYSQPVRIEDRIEDMAQVSDVQINGSLSFTRQITHNYPIGSFISSALISNDLKARVSRLFDQASWDSVTWADTPVGGVAAATYNNTLAPVVVTNRGAVSERWALRFTSSTAFQVIGEHVGVIDVGTINAVCSPINPATGTPYFTMSEAGWGVGWAVGNIVRLDTVGAQFPVWAVRTVQQGAESVEDDAFTILVRGDVDRP